MRVDLIAFGGFLLAISGVLGGLVLDGGHIADIAQASAAVIVLGGTIGAVVLTTPRPILKSALGKLRLVFSEHDNAPREMIDRISALATKARRHGLVSLERDLEGTEDPFLSKTLMLAIDGLEPDKLRKMMEMEMRLEAAEAETDAGVFEAAGGYAPTFGIVGAVMGLIQVMKHLDNFSQVGAGIAVAFVATLHGVGSANLLFLPIAQRIRLRSQQSIRAEQLILEGIIAMIEQMHPWLIRQRLEAFGREGCRTSGRPIEIAEPATRIASA
jgi:chemotaxis protein MotA